MTFTEAFEKIKTCIGKKQADAFFAVEVDLSDEDCGGAFYIANVDGNFAVEPYDYHDCTARVTATAKTVLDILKGTLDAHDAYESGALHIDGDAESVGKLSVLCRKPRKKAETSAEKAPAPKRKRTTKKPER